MENEKLETDLLEENGSSTRHAVTIVYLVLLGIMVLTVVVAFTVDSMTAGDSIGQQNRLLSMIALPVFLTFYFATTAFAVWYVKTNKTNSLWADAWRRLLKNKLATFGLIVIWLITLVVAAGPSVIYWINGLTPDYIPSDASLIRSMPPDSHHPMGTDEAGRDILARVLQGGRISLMVGIISTIVSLIVGVSYGAVAGYVGGRLDNIMMRFVDIIYAIPYILIVIVLLSVFGGQNTPGWIAWMSNRFGGGAGLSQIFLLFFALGLVSWLTMARVVRGQILSLKNQEFVLAARATGVSTWRIIFKHLVPNALGPVIVYATLTIPSVMLTEAFLSFLGIGVQAPYASWGSLASDGIKNIAIFPWQLIFPGVTMALTLFSLNFLGDGLRDALDPQTRKF